MSLILGRAPSRQGNPYRRQLMRLAMSGSLSLHDMRFLRKLEGAFGKDGAIDGRRAHKVITKANGRLIDTDDYTAQRAITDFLS